MQNYIPNKGQSWLQLNYLESIRTIPIVACCYVIYFDGELKYIGSTNNLRNRFSGHAIRYGYWKDLITPWRDFDLPVEMIIKYAPSRRYGDWLMREARLIRRLQPAFNSKLKGRKAA